MDLNLGQDTGVKTVSFYGFADPKQSSLVDQANELQRLNQLFYNVPSM